MKKLICLTAAAIALTLAAPANAQTAVAPAGQTAMPMEHGHEHHPEMHHAIHALEHSKADLEKAAHDYGGHRAKAIELINGALSELHQGLEFEEHEEHEHH